MTNARRSVSTQERERVIGSWDRPYPRVVSRDQSPDDLDAVFRLAGVDFPARLLVGAAPQTVAAVVKQLPVRGHMVHAIWSGEVIRQLEPFSPGIDESENATYACSPGDICFTAGWSELTLVYGDNDMRMPSGAVFESVFGVLTGNLSEFQRVCQGVRLLGVTEFELRLAGDA